MSEVAFDPERLKTKLVHCTNHEHAISEKRGMIMRFMGAEAKWYRKASVAIAEALKWKTNEALIDLWGDRWEIQLDQIRAFEPSAHISTSWVEKRQREEEGG